MITIYREAIWSYSRHSLQTRRQSMQWQHHPNFYYSRLTMHAQDAALVLTRRHSRQWQHDDYFLDRSGRLAMPKTWSSDKKTFEAMTTWSLFFLYKSLDHVQESSIKKTFLAMTTWSQYVRKPPDHVHGFRARRHSRLWHNTITIFRQKPHDHAQDTVFWQDIQGNDNIITTVIQKPRLIMPKMTRRHSRQWQHDHYF